MYQRISALCLFCILCVEAQYIVPDVLVEALSPRGFRVSIPDEEGISLFAFHGKINEEMHNREAGTFSVDINKPINGRWTYMTKGAKLKVGDKIYYWVNVDFDDGNGKRGYILDDQEFTVTELIPNGIVSTSSTTTTSTTTTTTTTAPTKASTVKSCRKTPTIVNGQSSCQGELIFEENFGGLSHRKWRPEIKFSGGPDYEFVIYQNNTENLYVKKNILHIKPTLTEAKYGSGYVQNSEGLDLGSRCTGITESSECYQKPRAWQILPPVISAQISTIDRLSFIYGSVEIRAKLPKGDWIYPELQLKSKNNEYGMGYDSGEIRIAFLPGNFNLSKTLTGGCILGQSTVARNYGSKNIRSEKHWNHDYHVYRVDWRTDRITLSVDDHVYGNIYPPENGFADEEVELEIESEVAERWKKGTKLAPFDKEMYLLLGVGVGGQSFPNRDDYYKPWDNDDPKSQLYFYQNQEIWSSTWNNDNELLVDYVKIWAI